MAFLGFGELLESKHVDRPEILQPLSEIVRLAPGTLEHEPLDGLDRRDEIGERNIQFVLAVLGRVLQPGQRLGLTDLDLGPLVTCLGRTTIEVSELLAHLVRHLTGARQGCHGGRQFDVLMVDLVACGRDAVRYLVYRGMQLFDLVIRVGELELLLCKARVQFPALVLDAPEGVHG